MGILERGGEVRATVIPSRRRHFVQAEIHRHIKAHSAIYSDNLASYDMLKHQNFKHGVVHHAERYIDGRIHTNGLGNFWSLTKRQLKGTYISVEPFHLFRYLDEQVYRFNNRELANDGERFQKALSQIAGKRLTYSEVTGKVGETKN
jgi:transposase-like protein